MQAVEKILFCLIVLLGIASLVSMTMGQTNVATGPVNASISQPITIQTSGNLSAGIFFTNGSTIGVQYPITDVTIENNATANYWGSNYGTEYWVQSASSNKINITIHFTACDDLKNSTLGSYINVTWDNSADGGQGAFFGNGTSATAPTLNVNPNYAFKKVPNWVVVGSKVDAGNTIYLRFWLDPWPNNAPSGIYNTTYKILAVEYGTDPGTASC
jgi:hypothetical protein